jgi:hypothetical protein
MTRIFLAGLALAALAVTAPAAAQEGTPQPLAVGTVAPDFEIPGATRYGVLRDPVRLSDFRGKTAGLLLPRPDAWLNDPDACVP